MMTSKEGNLQRKCLTYLKGRKDIWSMNVVGSPAQTSGVPDLLLCIKGQFVGVELKRPNGGILAPLQQAQINRIQRAGGVGVVIDNYEDFVKLVEKLYDTF